MPTDRINLIDLKERITTAGALGGMLVLNDAERAFLLDAVDEVSKPQPATAFLDPGYTLKRIERIWAFLSTDASGEGVCAAPMGGLGAVPLIAADDARMRSIKPLAQQIAKIFSRQVILAKFSKREDVETITP